MTAGKVHPHWLSNEEIAQLQQALVQAETGTKGEIIPIIVEQTHPWRHISAQIWMFLTSVGMALCWQFQDNLEDWVQWPPLVWILISSIVAFGLTLVLGRFHWWVRLFVSPQERAEAAETRAELEFSRRHFDRSTQHATIILLVAVLERQVVLLVEPELKALVPEAALQKFLSETTSALAQGFRQKDHAQACIKAIQSCGEILKKYVPGPSEYRHEFPAEIIYIES